MVRTGLSLVLLGAALSQPVLAQELNAISKVEVTGDAQKTVVVVTGSRRPTFQAYQQKAPVRVVVDLVKSQLKDVPATLPATGDGILKEVRTTQMGTAGRELARIEIVFNDDVDYQMDADGNALRLTATRHGPTAAQLAAAEKAAAEKAAAEKIAAEKAAAEKAEKERQELARLEKEKAEKLAAEKAAAEKAEKERQELARIEKEKAEKAELAKLDQEKREKALADKAAAEKAAAEKAELARLEKEAAEKAAAAQRALELARAEREKQEKAAAKKDAEAAAALAKAEKERADKEAKELARAEKERAARERDEQLRAEKEARIEKERADKEAKELARAEKERLEKMRAEVARAESEKRQQESVATEPSTQRHGSAADAPSAKDARESDDGFGGGKPAKSAPVTSRASASEGAREAEGESAGGPRVLTFVGFKNVGEQSVIVVRTNDKVAYNVRKVGQNKIVLELENCRILLRNNQRVLDTSYFPRTAIKMITPEEHEGASKTVRILIELSEEVPYEAKQDNNNVSVAFQRPAG